MSNKSSFGMQRSRVENLNSILIIAMKKQFYLYDPVSIPRDYYAVNNLHWANHVFMSIFESFYEISVISWPDPDAPVRASRKKDFILERDLRHRGVVTFHWLDEFTARNVPFLDAVIRWASKKGTAGDI